MFVPASYARLEMVVSNVHEIPERNCRIVRRENNHYLEDFYWKVFGPHFDDFYIIECENAVISDSFFDCSPREFSATDVLRDCSHKTLIYREDLGGVFEIQTSAFSFLWDPRRGLLIGGAYDRLVLKGKKVIGQWGSKEEVLIKFENSPFPVTTILRVELGRFLRSVFDQ